MSDAKQLKQLLLERVADLAPHLFPNGKREGNHWRVGSIEGEAGKSFDVCIAGQKAGLYGDFEKSEKHSNNLLDLWMQARNVDFKTALREAAEWLGLPQTKSKRTFPTLEDAIHAVRPPKMLVTRRDTYRDANGIVRLVVVRFDGKEGKEFRPFHQTPEGWVIADPPGKLPLLDLPELVRQDLNRESSSETVFVPEGEKCVRELRDKLGLLATTSAHGAKAPYKTDWTPLVGRKVVFLPDNDLGGQGYARSAAQILMQLSPQAKVKIVELPGLPEKGDCVDWIEARNGKPPEQIKAELLELAKNAEEIRQVAVEPVLLPQPPYFAPPLDLFPHEMQRFILAGAETFDVDRASFVLPVLTGAAATIGDARSIRLKEDYIEPPIIWSACIAPTGDAKSPVTQAATAPLRKREDQFMRLNKENAEEFARELAAWEATPKKERGKKPEKPPRLTCLMDDATIEAVALRLNDNPRGAALVKDELSHWFESFDQYHDRGGADVSRWLSIWNGFFLRSIG